MRQQGGMRLSEKDDAEMNNKRNVVLSSSQRRTPSCCDIGKREVSKAKTWWDR